MSEDKKPTIAPGDEDGALDAGARRREKKKGDFTKVIRLSWDENES
ncbi:hypothetical protein [Heliorestis convoluta]|uniref:Uncharacterized protein n=1 Tax=Heliorestis convoluta TaxID=356322 RepID=A0A5Q2N089_9FIRM|nr:hypothetical protein [Heliorestis convoluta]QGG46642.1 hypothetical protein FTV88_0463 [Heliorestis convoluta]